MRRREVHEDHVNHEAWAIPYGDLVTLLLAFFVVMYAVSSINEGKYRVMADALEAAFSGRPKVISPIQLGQSQLRGSSFDRPTIATPASRADGPSAAMPVEVQMVRQAVELPTFGKDVRARRQAGGGEADSSPEDPADAAARQLHSVGLRVEHALSDLVAKRLVVVRREYTYLEVEIRSDVLFASGVAVPNATARRTIALLAEALRGEPNAVRVEGYTDDRPISTPQFRSNWELSAARAASVVHAMIGGGIEPARLAVVGFGEQRPIADNRTDAGRNANRRVQLVILAAPGGDAIAAPAPPVADPPAAGGGDTPDKRGVGGGIATRAAMLKRGIH
ncbi:flagellar motor protein MotD [Luteimonas pelagia]